MLSEIYRRDQKRPQNQRFNAWIENLLLEIAEYDGKLREYGPFLRFENISDNPVLLSDNLLVKNIFICLHADSFFCEHHDSTGCAHVGFCYAISAV